MKKFLYYSDLVFLRLIPLAYFAVSIYASLSFTPFNMGGEFGVLEVMTGSIIILFCFLFLGCASVFRKFVPTKKVATVFKYIMSGVAMVYILGYVIKSIWVLSWGVAPAFFGSVIESQDEVFVVALALLIVCCFLKDSFYKLKWGLTVLCAVMFSVASALPMVSLMMFHDPIASRLIPQVLIFAFGCTSIIVTGLAPVKNKIANGVETLVLGE